MTATTSSTAVQEFTTAVGPGAVTPDLLSQVGWEDPSGRSSTAVVLDHGYTTMDSTDPDVVVMPLADALLTYPWVQDLMWSLIDPDEDEVLRRAFESTRTPLGTFTWVKDNAKVEMPRQSFTVMTVPQERQFVHDITVIGRNAEVDSVSGSAVAPGLTQGSHVSVGETFIGDGARLRSVDVDRWGPEMSVHTYDRTRVGEGATVSSVSIAVSALRKARSTSVTELGKDARCTSHSIVFAPEGTDREMEDQTILTGPGARAEMVARMVSDGGRISNASTLTSTAPDVKGFLECDGLLLRDGGGINSVPSLDAKIARAQLSHEASVGMIDDDKLDYLKALGMDEDAARDLIVQGFLNLEDSRIPASVRDRVTELVSAARGAEKM
ncbi:SufD family Fe-S cluster assembly protein [uncultured Corynebacterium sp.]|uniref:SufD family Fe-S cluster assembly protein n=1 Tax=uncultured Corynebacterium sp. TaxID=159447 RepID=UPI0025D56092|nr:SufD family Fe-S cluster assembly protein [uncultured Corynebacterium sp.]